MQIDIFKLIKAKIHITKESMKMIHNQRPSVITTIARFEFCGALMCSIFLLFLPPGSPDWIASMLGALFGFVVTYGLWTLQFWAFWLTIAYESLSIVYELFFLTQSGYRSILYLIGPLFGILLSALTIGYLLLDHTSKPSFRRSR
jgi:hypothetical protein